MVWYSDKNKTAKQVVVGFCFFPFFFFFVPFHRPVISQ